MALRTPLALRNLTEVPSRFALSCGAISFAVILMFMQAGFLNALLDSPVQVIETLGGDLVAISPANYAIASEQRFPLLVFRQLKAHPDVESVMPVYIERTFAQLRVPGKVSRYIRVIAIPSHGFQVADPELNALLPLLAEPNSALIDRRSKNDYGLTIADPVALAAQEVELNGKQIRIVGQITIGTDFAHDGNMIIGQENLAEYFAYRGAGEPLSSVDLAVMRIDPRADRDQVVNELNAIAKSEGVKQFHVLTREGFIEREQAFWSNATPVGIIFRSGMLVGFAVGVIICYQILFTEIYDHMPEFATLKAMGYSNVYFVKLVLQQSWMLATFGFLPGWLVSWGLFRTLAHAAGLPMTLEAPGILMVFGLTLVMCSVGGLLAMRKLIGADPATLF